MAAINYTTDSIKAALQKLEARLTAAGAPANAIGYGSGDNTPTGDTVAVAFTKIQARITSLAPSPNTTYANSTMVRANYTNFSALFLNIQQQIAAKGG